MALTVLEKPAGARRVAAKLFDKFETLLLDLDGVIYEGENAIVEAVESITAINSNGIKVGYITNNSSRKPETIADQLRGFGIELSKDDVITSAQAGVELLATMIPKGSKVLVVGGEGLRFEVQAAGFELVSLSDDKPAAVIQGFAPEVVHTAVGQLPVVAGKPERAIFETAMRKFEAKSAIYVGDRLDTDVAGANQAGLGSALVMTGVTTRKELLAAKPDSRPTYILETLKDLRSDYRAPSKTKRGCKLGDVEVELLGEKVVVSFGDPKSLDALKAACMTIWDCGTPIHLLDVESALYE